MVGIRYGTAAGSDGKDFYLDATEDLPDPKTFGKGTLQRGLEFYTCDGNSFNAVSKQFASVSDFNAAGGVAANIGPVWIAGVLYWGDGVSLTTQGTAGGSTVQDYVGATITTYKSTYLGFKPTDTGLATKLQNFLNSAGPEICVEFEPGKYTFDGPITVAQNGVHLRGKGVYATELRFAPSADSDFLTISKGASIAYNCQIEKLSLYSANTTNAKTAISAKDVSGLVISDVLIKGFKGKDSHGFRMYGRENNTIEKLRVADTDICIRFSPNPNTAEWLSIDHTVLRDCYLTPTSAASAGGTIPTTNILIDDKSNISGLTIEGRNAWAGGERGLYNLDTTSTMASFMVKIATLRREQPSNSAYAAIHIERNAAAGKLQSIKIENFYTGVGQKGLYMRGIDNIIIENTTISDTTYDVIDVDNCSSMEWVNFMPSSSNAALFKLPNMVMVKGAQALTGKVYPFSATWNKAELVYAQKFARGMNGARTYEWAGDIATGTITQMPINTEQNSVKCAIMEVCAVATDGTEFEAGIFAISFGTNAAAADVKGVMRVSGTAKMTTTNTTGNFVVYCTSASTNIFNNVNLFNRLGKNAHVVVRAVIY